jgi:transcriptional regulator of arginine metabolism
MTVVHSRAARHQRVVDLLARHRVRSQGQLADLLAGEGFAVTQATLSRDLDELGAVKVRDADGQLCYAVPGEGGDLTPRPAPDGVGDLDRLRRRCEDLLVSVDSSANIVILRTPPGGAQFLASAVDHSVLPEVIGTVAGDDTVLLVTRDPVGGAGVAAHLLGLAAGTGGEPAYGGPGTDPHTDPQTDLRADPRADAHRPEVPTPRPSRPAATRRTQGVQQ